MEIPALPHTAMSSKRRTDTCWREEANDLEGRFSRVRYTAVRRAHNELADRLVNEALDAES